MLGRYSATSMLAYSRMAGRARGFVASGWVRVLGLVIAVTIVAWLAELARVTAFAKEPLPAGAWLDPGRILAATALFALLWWTWRARRAVVIDQFADFTTSEFEKFARTGAFLPALRRTRSYPRPLSKDDYLVDKRGPKARIGAIRSVPAVAADLQAPAFTDDNAAREAMEAVLWPDGPLCPRCPLRRTHRQGERQVGSARPLLLRRLQGQFTVTVGTIFERSNVPLHKWCSAVHLLRREQERHVSAHQLHRMLA